MSILPAGISAVPSDPDALAGAYVFPETDRPWVRAVFVSSLDGAATLDERSGGLGDSTDRRIFALCRALADVVLVGAGTVRAEGYGPVEVNPEWRFLREHRPPAPPIAVITRRLDLDLSAPLFASAPSEAPTIVVTSASAPTERRRAAGKVAEVIVAGDSVVDPAAAVAALAERGHRRISCEGGPQLLAELARADRLDELCLTLSPLLVCGDAIRITNGPAADAPLRLAPTQVLSDGSHLFLRYART